LFAVSGTGILPLHLTTVEVGFLVSRAENGSAGEADARALEFTAVGACASGTEKGLVDAVNLNKFPTECECDEISKVKAADASELTVVDGYPSRYEKRSVVFGVRLCGDCVEAHGKKRDSASA